MVDDRECVDTQFCTQSDSYNKTLKLGTTYEENYEYFVYLLLQCCCKRVFVLL